MTKIKIFLCVVVGTILLLSLLFINSEHEYDLADITKIETEEELKNVVYEVKEDKEKIDDSILGILTIEKINLQAKVKEGSTTQILAKYIGHISETNKYDGNVGLAAHNRLNKYSYFARLNELELNDENIK